ncbi:hypothetical protein NQ015_02620 [Corynebacterium sp. 153RC1]|uniref:hypothetical protein n=1 Tax=unclassified Corynebacterium TaxID=2624378 RepID=UPI00211C9336|nr:MULTISPECIES: hypothetical protein [unclassified Corynebacterium]MCQ9351768.1 hypothetical protein [Corynebacterium sp. 209RC1]MCQ9354504.1 hypothetical protein [Corynebacterium sp. 1222RC1]MCQ9356050.1 hypothetical protein [Corynebacterium sp. 122RC1]MCQ9358682.1 hypothetical protein [Corynebacterium sp. 142RC1]MCQ9360664.1 hypothetical protein [Corynebacterium sp. 153RC1]
MTEKQLTVAELLARSGKAAGEGESTRRRRRRSLEEGGISVAELTGNIPKVDAKPAESKHSSHPIDEEHAEPKPSPNPKPAFNAAKVAPAEPEKAPSKVADDETIVLSVVDEKDPVRLTTGSFKAVSTPAPTQTPAPTPTPAPVPAATAVREPAPAEQEGDAAADLDAHEGAADVGTAAPEKPALGVVLLMAAVGTILGAAVFKVFEWLWGNLSTPVVVVLALLVVAAYVGVVHVMRTENDKFNKVLAAVAGLLMTFGPALVV